MHEAAFEALAETLKAPRHEPVTFTGVYELVVATVLIDAVLLQAVLPSGLELRKVSRVLDRTHPMILTFGTQRNVTTMLGQVPIVLNYREAAFCIPNTGVVGDAQNRVAMYMPRLDVDSLAAAMMGWIVGYEKKLNHIDSVLNQFVVHERLSGKELYALTSLPRGDVGKPSDYPNFLFTMNLLKQPIVSVDGVGDFVFTVMDWQFDNAAFRSTQSQLTVVRDGLPAPRGSYEWSGYDTDVAGTAQLGVSWVLTGPFFDWPLAGRGATLSPEPLAGGI